MEEKVIFVKLKTIKKLYMYYVKNTVLFPVAPFTNMV